jgi:Flp pilus assembly protein TadD
VEAVRIARRLVEEEPRNPEHQLTLGAACVGAGDWRGAVSALDRPQPDLGSSTALANLLQARSYKNLGREDEARRLYQAALSWFQEHPNLRLEVRRIRAETEAILGIHKQ